MVDARTAPFVMHGAREVLALTGEATHLEQQITAIENAVTAAPNLAIDLARTLIETICKTILNDRGQPDCESSRFNDLLQQTYSSIQLLPDAKLALPESQAALLQLAENLDVAIFSISKLRQVEGIASHGKDAYFSTLEEVQAEFAARAADALVSFLYKSHRRYSGNPPIRLLEYGDHPDFNEYIDTSNEVVRLFDYEYKPSEVLFLVDRQAYRDLFASISPDMVDDVKEGV